MQGTENRFESSVLTVAEVDALIASFVGAIKTDINYLVDICEDGARFEAAIQKHERTKKHLDGKVRMRQRQRPFSSCRY
jgi:hypothetical protein